MKKSLLLLVSVLFPLASLAADRIGNGGGVWACTETNGRIRKATLVDLFEARQEFQLFVSAGLGETPQEIYEARKQWMRAKLPALFTQFESSFKKIEDGLVMADAALVVVDDSLFRVTPLATDCEGGRWDYTQLANFTGYGKILIRSDLWKNGALPAMDKAALLFHEAIYFRLRQSSGDTDSVRARQITGLLFSNLPVREIEERVLALMDRATPAPRPTPTAPTQWTCSTYNTSYNMTFLGVGMTEIEAGYQALTTCESNGSASYCSQEPACEPIQSVQESIACTAYNTSYTKTFLGKGRSAVEAKAKAMMACEKNGSASYCKIVRCSGN